MTLMNKIVVCDMVRAEELLKQRPCEVGAVVRTNILTPPEEAAHAVLLKSVQVSEVIQSFLFLPDTALLPAEAEAANRLIDAYADQDMLLVEREIAALHLKAQQRELNKLVLTASMAMNGLSPGKKLLIHDSNGLFRAPATAFILMVDEGIQQGKTVEQAFNESFPAIYQAVPEATLLEKLVPNLLGSAVALLEQQEDMIPLGQTFGQRVAFYEDEISRYGCCVRLCNSLAKFGSYAAIADYEMGHYALPKFMKDVPPSPAEIVSMQERAALVSLLYRERAATYGLPPMRPDAECDKVLAKLCTRGFNLDAVGGEKWAPANAPGLAFGS